MASIFVRSLALAGATEAACVTNASRTPADGTFAVSSRHEGVIQVYAASCAALLHEFATIHAHVHALHYTSFSDSLVTLESDRPSGVPGGEDLGSDDEETFLCVYHDWRERDMVRGYTLPLGVLDAPSTKRKAECVAVCSYTGRVVVAMGAVLNIWQCSQGFFEHVMEIKVDMTQLDAYHVLEFVAIHGVYVAFGSSTEVRVMEVHVHNASDIGEAVEVSPQVAPSQEAPMPVNSAQTEHQETPSVPEDDFSCVHFDTQGDTSSFDSISIPLASYGDTVNESDYLHLHEKSTYGDNDETPVVLDRNEAQHEELNLAGLLKMQDIRVNQAMNYHVAEKDVRIILRRYLPPNQRIQTLKFLPETIDNHVSLEARSYTRLLVCTVDHAFLYYFLSSEADATRKRMVKKVLGKADFKRQISLSTRSSPTSAAGNGDHDTFGADTLDVESGRVVMHYAFSSPVTCITANSSFLFVTSSSSLQVWSIWSPCHHLAATRTLSSSVHLEPTQPQLISVEALDNPVCDIAALDAYVVVLPREQGTQSFELRDFIRTASAAAAERLPPSPLEIRGGEFRYRDQVPATSRSMRILQQSPPSAIFSLLRSKQPIRSQTRVDMLLSLYSLYRYRADVGANTLSEANEMLHSKSRMEAREAMAMELETRLYDRLACDCAAALAGEFVLPEMRDLSRAALFYVESRVSPTRVMQRFQTLAQSEVAYSEQVVQAIHKYLEARVFQSGDSNARRIQKPSPGRPAGEASDRCFTQSVVTHYVKHAPEQLPRLLIDSCLSWTLEDLHFGFETLKGVKVSDTSLVNIAQLVLTIRAQSLPEDQWNNSRQTDLALYDAMQSACSYEALCKSVDKVVREDAKALIRLCVSHPDMLIDGGGTGRSTATASSLSRALLACTPHVFAQVLEAVFDSAISRRESIIGSVLLCVTAMGESVRPSVERITSEEVIPKLTQRPTITAHFVFLRFVCYVLDAFPRLRALADKDELSEDDEELLAIRRSLAMELLHVCVDFVSTAQDATNLSGDLETLHLILPSSGHVEASALPDWELTYLETWCTPRNVEALAPVTLHFLKQALGLLHEPELLKAQDILTSHERSPANDFALLLVLLALPQTNRTVTGLGLLAEREAFVELFLPYCKCYCCTLEEWKFAIESLSSLSEGKMESREPHGKDELGVLESVLSHMCATLGPEDLLEVLPDDGDLAMFMATIEASVRLEDARTRRVPLPSREVAW